MSLFGKYPGERTRTSDVSPCLIYSQVQSPLCDSWLTVQARLELATLRLTAECSAVELLDIKGREFLPEKEKIGKSH